MWEIDDVSSIKKLKSIVQNRFGKGLEIRRLSVLKAMEPESEFFFKNQDMIIPIYQDQTYLGTAVVADGKDIDKEQVHTLLSLVRMTLVPTLYSYYQNVQENNLKIIESISLDNLNSLDSKYDDFGMKSESAKEVIQDISFESDVTMQVVSNVLHLNGINELILKVAHQIHELTHRWAFVPFKDLNIQFSSIEELKKLGAMTIFISDLNQLNYDQQMVIADYQKLGVNDSHPLLVVGTTETLEELANNPKITADLLFCLDQFTFEVNKAPMNYKKLKEVVEILFFSQQ